MTKCRLTRSHIAVTSADTETVKTGSKNDFLPSFVSILSMLQRSSSGLRSSENPAAPAEATSQNCTHYHRHHVQCRHSIAALDIINK